MGPRPPQRRTRPHQLRQPPTPLLAPPPRQDRTRSPGGPHRQPPPSRRRAKSQARCTSRGTAMRREAGRPGPRPKGPTPVGRAAAPRERPHWFRARPVLRVSELGPRPQRPERVVACGPAPNWWAPHRRWRSRHERRHGKLIRAPRGADFVGGGDAATVSWLSEGPTEPWTTNTTSASVPPGYGAAQPNWRSAGGFPVPSVRVSAFGCSSAAGPRGPETKDSQPHGQQSDRGREGRHDPGLGRPEPRRARDRRPGDAVPRRPGEASPRPTATPPSR
jgi:hypothetical protein